MADAMTVATRELVREYMRLYLEKDIDGMAGLLADGFTLLTRQGAITTVADYRTWVHNTIKLSENAEVAWKVESETYSGEYGLYIVSLGRTIPLVALTFYCTNGKILFFSLASYAEGLVARSEGIGRYRQEI